jgi:transposase-like protein
MATNLPRCDAVAGPYDDFALGQHYVPEFVTRWNRFRLPAAQSWRVDETYVKIRGQWPYLYRAVDRAGKTVDFRLSARRDVTAAKAFFKQAIKSQDSVPRTITLDGYAASHRAVREMKRDGLLPGDTTLRSSKYLNNLIKQDHRNIKSRVNVMLGSGFCRVQRSGCQHGIDFRF